MHEGKLPLDNHAFYPHLTTEHMFENIPNAYNPQQESLAVEDNDCLIFSVITENDESNWEDKTGEQYHFPKKYLEHLRPGALVIYYKGKMKNRAYNDRRLSSEPHYFGYGKIGRVWADPNSNKGDYFASIIDFKPFSTPVLARTSNEKTYIEHIPPNKESNYWRDAVRPVSKAVHDEILRLAGHGSNESEYSDLSQGLEKAYESLLDGQKRQVSGSRYERNPVLRHQAIQIHGLTCKACGHNFEKVYGPAGAGYIHVHHLRPLAENGEPQMVDPRSDLTVLCANCHAMIHRKRNDTLTVEQLRVMIEAQRSSLRSSSF